MLDRALLERLDFAVAEAGYVGVRIAPDLSAAFAMLTVRALPEVGPIDAEQRRYLHFLGVTTLEFSRWADDAPWDGVPTLLPLASPEDLEALLDDAREVDPVGGLRNFDIADPVPRLAAEPGLRLGMGPVRSGHSWRWSAEVVEADGRRSVVDVGIWFADLAVERFDRRPITLVQFADDGYRWWTAMRAGDPRVGVQAQRDAGLAVILPAGGDPSSASIKELLARIRRKP